MKGIIHCKKKVLDKTKIQPGMIFRVFGTVSHHGTHFDNVIVLIDGLCSVHGEIEVSVCYYGDWITDDNVEYVRRGTKIPECVIASDHCKFYRIDDANIKKPLKVTMSIDVDMFDPNYFKKTSPIVVTFEGKEPINAFVDYVEQDPQQDDHMTIWCYDKEAKESRLVKISALDYVSGKVKIELL